MRIRMGYRIFCALLLLGVASPLGAAPGSPVAPPVYVGPAATAITSPVPAKSGPVLIEADAQHIIVDWVAPAYQLTRETVEGSVVDRVLMSGCPSAGKTGEPELPSCSVLLGIPPDAQIELSVVEDESIPVVGDYAIAPVPTQTVEEQLPPAGPASIQVTGRRWEEGPAYSLDSAFPPQRVQLGEPAFLRHQRLVAINFYPFEYQPRFAKLVYHSRVRLQVTLSRGSEPMGFVAEPATFERLLEKNLLNYTQAREWRRTTIVAASTPMAPPDPGWRIPISRDGIYRLTYAQLRDAGLPVDTLDPRTLRLYRYGSEVSILVEGEDDGYFDPTDSLLFYGQRLENNRYTNTEAYWLTYGGPQGRRMAERDGTPHGAAVPASFPVTERLEENHLYYSQLPWRSNHDHWFWTYTWPRTGLVAQTYTFPVHSLSQESYTATVRLHMNSYNNDQYVQPDHHIRVRVNGTLVGEYFWESRAEVTLTLAFPSSLLYPNSNNVVRAEAPGDTGASADIVMHDWAELDERRLYSAEQDRLVWKGQAGTWEYHLTNFSAPSILFFDKTDSDNPQAITGAAVEPDNLTYAVRFQDTVTRTTAYIAVMDGQILQPDSVQRATPADLLNPANGADYLVVTYGGFYSQALALADFQASRGLRTMVIDVDDTYDLFGYGRRIPEATHDFLAYAYNSWTAPAPSYVVLMGDGTYDPKNYLLSSQGEFLLPYLAFVDPIIGETAADNRYVCLSGGDLLADIYLGRLPANTPAQAQIMVDKIVAYESNPPSGDWNRHSLVTADNADQAGNFAQLSDALLASYYPPPYQSQRVYLGVTCPYEWPSAACRSQIIAAINQGQLLVNYIGHGATQQWATEKLLDNAALGSLSNGPYLPVALAMTCNDGAYQIVDGNPSKWSLAETFVRAQGKGWVASWSPTGQGVATGHDYLDRGFLQAILLDDVRQLGPATMAGKLRLFQAGASPDLLDTYVLIGDPALEMPLLETNVSLSQEVQPTIPILPGDMVTFTMSLANEGPATAHHVVLADVLSPLFVNPVVNAEGVTVTARGGTRYIWDVDDMVAGQAGTVRVVARLYPHAPPGYITNQAIVATSASETNGNDNAASVNVLVTVGPPYYITATATPPTLPADGTSLATLHVEVADLAGNPVQDGTLVAMHTSAGTFLDGTTDYQALTSGGTVQAILRSSTLIETADVAITSEQASGHLHVPFVPMEPATVTVLAVPGTITPTGSSQITATVQDALGHPVADGTTVSFATSLGMIIPTQNTTIDGHATTTLHGDGHVGLAAILAQSGNAAGTAEVQVVPDAPAGITVTATPPSLPADGISLALVHAQVVDSSGNPVADGTPVTMTTNAGTFYDGNTTFYGVTLQGGAEAFLRASPLVETATVVAYAGDVWGEVSVPFTPMAPYTLTLVAASPVITLTGATSLTASVTDILGHPVANGTTVSFSTSLGEISPVQATTVDGRVLTTLRGTNEHGVALVTADSGAAADYTLVQIGAGSDMSLTLAVDPAMLPADGSSQATVTATLRWADGDPITESRWVSFTATLGTVPPGAFTSGGTAVVSFTAGTTMGQAIVLARSGSAAAAATIRLTAGEPTAITLTASPDTLPVGGANSLLAAAVYDGLGHPVADGTPVSFVATLGTVAPTATLTFDGRAQSTILSGPLAGTAVVTAAVGTLQTTVSVRFLPLEPATLTLDVSPTVLLADGVSTATVTTWAGDRFGNPVQDGTPVQFLTDQGQVVPTETQSAAGYATTTLVAGTQVGQATVRALAGGLQAQSAITLVAGPPAAITLTAQPEQVPVGGHRSVLVATVHDAWNHSVVDGTLVTVTSSLGTVAPAVVSTLGGDAVSTLQSGPVAGTAFVTATSGTAMGSAVVLFAPLAPFTLTLSVDPPVLPADGTATAIVSAWVADRLGNPAQDDTLVQLMTSQGVLTPTMVGTSGGWAVATLTADLQVVTATVQAMVGDLQVAVQVPMVIGPPASVWVSALPGRLYANGVSTATVSVQVRDSGGHPVADGTPVTLNSSLGTISPTLALTQDGGVRGVFRDSLSTGWATIRAVCGEAVGETVVEMYRYTYYLPLVHK